MFHLFHAFHPRGRPRRSRVTRRQSKRRGVGSGACCRSCVGKTLGRPARRPAGRQPPATNLVTDARDTPRTALDPRRTGRCVMCSRRFHLREPVGSTPCGPQGGPQSSQGHSNYKIGMAQRVRARQVPRCSRACAPDLSAAAWAVSRCLGLHHNSARRITRVSRDVPTNPACSARDTSTRIVT